MEGIRKLAGNLGFQVVFSGRILEIKTGGDRQALMMLRNLSGMACVINDCVENEFLAWPLGDDEYEKQMTRRSFVDCFYTLKNYRDMLVN